MSSALSISITDIPTVIAAFYEAQRTPMFVSAPGQGKTALVRAAGEQLAQKFGEPVPVIELHLTSMSEVDLRGYLVPKGDDSTFTKPPFWSQVEASPRGILFLDEFAQANHEVQKAAAPLLLDGRIGDWELPEGWMVACASNRTTDRAGANSMLSHVLNRIGYIECKAMNAEDFTAWGAKAGLLPELLAFANLRPEAVFGVDPPDADDTPYCTPRSVHALSDVATYWQGGIGAMMVSQVGMAVAAGIIGRGAASELAGLVKTANALPSYNDIVKDPLGTFIPDAPDACYAATMMTAMNAKVEHRDPVIQYLTRFNANYTVVGLVALVNRNLDFAACKTMQDWCLANQPLLTRMRNFIRVKSN